MEATDTVVPGGWGPDGHSLQKSIIPEPVEDAQLVLCFGAQLGWVDSYSGCHDKVLEARLPSALSCQNIGLHQTAVPATEGGLPSCQCGCGSWQEVAPLSIPASLLPTAPSMLLGKGLQVEVNSLLYLVLTHVESGPSVCLVPTWVARQG